LIQKLELNKERELVERAKKDAEAFALLYDLYIDDVFRFVLYKVQNKHIAEDIVSETFEKAIKKIGSFQWQGYRFSTWLYTIARNIIIDNARKHKIELSLEEVFSFTKDEELETLEDGVLRKTRILKLVREIEELSEEQREIIYLRYIKELSVKETMDITGKSVDSVKSMTKRALQNLKLKLSNY
jgi:RNA polymerase sigma factor (sigma-70 family)